MGIQIGGGEWLLGPAVTAKYGGSLMWIATVAIVLQHGMRKVRVVLRRACFYGIYAM